MSDITRRDFLRSTAAASMLAVSAPSLVAHTSDDWDAGQLRHIIPSANHDAFLIKTSFQSPLSAPPVLQVDAESVAGMPSDTQGRFWSFHVPGLAPDTTFELQLFDAGGDALCDRWPLKTFPAPDAEPERFRLAVYTCAGGSENVPMRGKDLWIPISQRQRLLDRMLGFAPDAVVGVGDQIYWDQITGVYKYINYPLPGLKAAIEAQWDQFGRFDRAKGILGTSNESVLMRVCDDQLGDLYGTRLRSFPTILTQDDHDYFENDEATDEFVAFPPDNFMMRAARATQRLYFPEFLPDSTRPDGLGVIDAGPQPMGEAYGTLRYGNLFEGLLYDCRRFVTLSGPNAVFVEREAERWLLDRMASSGARYVVNMPSTPFGWSAGKFGEWYPDVNQGDGTIGTAKEKPYWQSGWFSQHQRIAEAASAMDRLPLFISGDLHAVGSGTIVRSGDLDLRSNPIHSVLSGPISSGGPTFATTFRGVGASVPDGLEVEESIPPLEKNGFTIFDFTPESVTYRQFAWRGELGDSLGAIDSMEPVNVVEMPSGV